MIMLALFPIPVALAAVLAMPGAGDASEEERVQPALSSRLKRIQAAFRQYHATSVRPSLPTTGKLRAESGEWRISEIRSSR